MPVLTVGSKRVLYIHVPKTGGTSVETLLDSYGGVVAGHANPRAVGLPCTPQHFHAPLLRQVYGDIRAPQTHDFDLVAMTVREPLSRLLSEYRYQRTTTRSAKIGGSAWSRRPVVAEMLNFPRWCHYALARSRRDPFFLDNHMRPQAHFSVWNPQVFRLEDGLAPLKSTLDNLLGVEGVLPKSARMVATDRSGATSELRGRTLREIVEYFHDDFGQFGYRVPDLG